MDKKTTKSKKALVLGQGGLAGAYSAGFVSELCRQLGNKYFDSVYCYSVGSTIGTFFVANQPQVIENTWQNYVSGKQLIKPFNFLKRKPILDLDYLVSLFQNKKAKLNIDAVMSSGINLQYVLIDYNSGEINCLKPDKINIFKLIKACCSLPIVHGPSEVDDKLFFDAAFVYGGLPFLEKIANQYDEIVVVLNFPKDYRSNLLWWPVMNIFFPIASYFYPKKLRTVFKRRKNKWKEIFKCAEKNKHIKILAPNRLFLGFGGDSNKKHIHKTIDLGKQDAKEFITQNHLL
ncbi:MAG: patatin-like phospholipase family protein [Candidatus Paceibacterota bacterium]|jgi:predicted patatin/cPLA2 family phospholipase